MTLWLVGWSCLQLFNSLVLGVEWWHHRSSHWGAFKTAQALKDFNHGENLPVMIFANWRGFSGGTRDMYNEILKFGAMIVDALVPYLTCKDVEPQKQSNGGETWNSNLEPTKKRYVWCVCGWKKLSEIRNHLRWNTSIPSSSTSQNMVSCAAVLGSSLILPSILTRWRWGGPWGHGGCWSVWEIIEGYRDEVYLNTDANNFLESLRSLVFVPLVLGFLPPLSMNESFRFFPSKKKSATFSLSGDVCRCRRQGWYPGTSRHRGGEVPCSSAGIDDHLHRTGPMMSVGNGRLRMNAKYKWKINYHTRHLRCEVHLSMKNICVEAGDHESLLSQHLKQITHQNLFPPS